MVADMVGYSRRLAQRLIATHAAFRAHVDDVFAPLVLEHGGRVVKTTGDGVVAILKDAVQAEACARAIQLQLRRDADPSTRPIKYRIAIHYGKIIIEKHDVFGLDVNIAIHMQRLAPAGGVCISSPMYARLPEQSRKQYEYQGQKHLKNVPEPIAVHTYAPDATSADRSPFDGGPPVPRRSYLSPPPRLGVASLRTVGRGDAQDILSGLAQDCLIRILSRFRDVFSICLVGGEVPALSARGLDSRKFLSNELGCEYLIHGTCLTTSTTMELTVHLESLIKRELIWSARCKIDLETQLDLIEDLVAAEIVAPIVLYLGRADTVSWSVMPQSADGFLFQTARQLIEQRTLESLKHARCLLLEIRDRCGEIGDVYLALARAEHSYGLLCAGQQFTDALEIAWRYAKKAIEIEDLNPQAHAELALQEMFLKRQSDAAAIYEYALRLNPYDAMLRADWADCLVNTGRAAEAIQILEEVLSGWPRDRAWVEWNLCDAYWMTDRPDRIVALLDRHPDQPHVHRLLAASYAKLGRIQEAQRHADKVRQHQPGFSTKAWSRVVPFASSDTSEEYAEYLERAGL